MIYSSSDLVNKLGSFSKVKAAVKKGEYFKISHGFYSDNLPATSELENLFARYPNAILTLQSAFAFYDLSDYIPTHYVVATRQGAHKIENNKVKQIYVTDELLNIGKTIVKTKYGVINIYDKERLLIELFRLKSKLSYPYFKEIVNSYRNLFKEEKLNNSKLVKYCSLFKTGLSIRKQIQEVII